MAAMRSTGLGLKSLVRHLTLIAAGVGFAMAAGCGANNESVAIEEIRELPAAERWGTAAASDAERFGFAPSAAIAPTSTAVAFSYDVPEGWTEIPPAEFRNPNFMVTGHPETEIYVTRLEGTGGGLAANINRWRGQFGLAPLTEAELAGLPKIEAAGGEGVFVSFTGEFRGMGGASRGEAMLHGVVVERPGEAIFIKMTGPPDVVQSQAEAFKAFAASLKPVEGTMAAGEATSGALTMQLPAGHPPMDAMSTLDGALPAGHPDVGQSLPAGHPDVGAAMPGMVMTDMSTASGQLQWRKPEGWTEAPARAMREVTFHAGADGEVECYVSILGGAAGDAEANINRWRGQMGQSPLTAAEIGEFKRIAVLGQDAPLVEIEGSYRGMGGEALEEALMLGSMAALEGQTVFVKMVGPRSAVAAQREAFIQFCRSLRPPEAENQAPE